MHDVDLSSHVVVVELEADATGETAGIIAGPVPTPIKPRGARWTLLFQPCRCRVLARRVLWNWRTLKVHNGELYMCNYRWSARTTCHCVRPCCIWACTAARCVPLAAARSAFEEFNFLYVKVHARVATHALQPAKRRLRRPTSRRLSHEPGGALATRALATARTRFCTPAWRAAAVRLPAIPQIWGSVPQTIPQSRFLT